jgi:hypothetical protein
MNHGHYAHVNRGRPCHGQLWLLSACAGAYQTGRPLGVSAPLAAPSSSARPQPVGAAGQAGDRTYQTWPSERDKDDA